MAARRIEVITGHIKGRQYVTPNQVSSESYKFTVENNIFTKNQRDFYEKNGYIVIKNFVPGEVIDKCRKHFIDLCNGVADKGLMVMMKEVALMNTEYTGEKLYNKVQDILYDDIFSLYTEYPKLLDIVSCFTGPNITAIHSMLINKPPGTQQHPPHQDLFYFPFRPADRIVATWTAMESIYKENGCLYVIPGTHKGDLYKHSYPMGDNNKVNKAFLCIENENEIAPESERLYLPMEKGDTVFFHPVIIHGSRPNTTNGFRKAISCHYADSECHYINAKGTIQEEIGIEIENIAKSKGLDVDFQMFWHYRSKVVRGVRMNL